MIAFFQLITVKFKIEILCVFVCKVVLCISVDVAKDYSQVESVLKQVREHS